MGSGRAAWDFLMHTREEAQAKGKELTDVVHLVISDIEMPEMDGHMRIELITMWYNEEFLAPFFLQHYNYADRINILYDTDTTDNTKKICEQYPNVRIIPFHFPNMMDDEIKRDLINDLYSKIDADWVLSVDSDEFAFLKEHNFFIYDFRNFLAADKKHDIYNVMLYQVYRHITDKDLDPDLPAVPQRRHGDPNISVGINALYKKPILVRGNLSINWEPGCHSIRYGRDPRAVAPQHVLGAHWAMGTYSTLSILKFSLNRLTFSLL